MHVGHRGLLAASHVESTNRPGTHQHLHSQSTQAFKWCKVLPNWKVHQKIQRRCNLYEQLLKGGRSLTTA
jgi:hypothetical protein